MSRWFRHYCGLARDEKLVSVAVKSRQPVERVIWVWTAILESASEINDAGRYHFDAAEAAYFLRCDDADLGGILASMESLGRIADGVVVRWGDRQYSSDSAAERQRRYRERKSGKAGILENDRNDKRDGDVTVTSPSVTVTAQDTDTDTDTDTDKKVPKNSTSKDLAEFRETLASLGPDRLDALIKVRKAKKAPINAYAANLLSKAAITCQISITEAADMCIERNWLTVKPDWISKPVARGSPNGGRRTVVTVLDELIEGMENAESVRSDQSGFRLAQDARDYAPPQLDFKSR